MSDLVKRLRMYEGSDRAKTEHEAADRIEELEGGDCKFECRKNNAKKVKEAFMAGAFFGEGWYVVEGYGDDKRLTAELIRRACRRWKDEN